MACTHPYRIFPTGWLTENGKPEYFFTRMADPCIPAWQVEKRFHHPQSRDLTDYIEVPCGHCYECRKDYSRRWAFRIQAEAQHYPPEQVWFFTFTYDNEHLPKDGFPPKSDFSLFLRKLRDLLGHEKPLRFFSCGELGGKTERPHIHAVLFGFDFFTLSKVKWSDKLWTFPVIEGLWGKGFCPGEPVIDPSTVGSYVAKYQLKGHGRSGCWLNFSRRPGLGLDFIEENLNAEGLCLLSNGRGKVLRSTAPKALKERLGIDPNPDGARAQMTKTINAMRACGYSVSMTQEFKFIERFRENKEYSDAAAEVFRKSLKK